MWWIVERLVALFLNLALCVGWVGQTMRKIKKTAQRIFGLERFYPGQQTSSGLDEHKVIETLARLSSDVNWLKKGWWLLIGALIISQIAG